MNRRWLTILLVVTLFAVPKATAAQREPPLIFFSIPLDDPTRQASARFGRALAGVGDVNGDGIPDLLVGARLQDVAGNDDQGQAFLFSGANGALLFTLDDPTPQARANFGFALAGVGDVNGDTVPDLLVGAISQDVDGNSFQGQVFLFSGANGALLRTLDDPIPQANARFGFALAGPGDLNGDGIPDLLVGATGHNSRRGQAFLFSGANGALLFTLDHPTPQSEAFFSFALAGVGDLNGDTVPDLLVGAPFHNVPGTTQQGQVFLFSGANGALLRTLDDPTPQASANFGFALAGPGDVNGDGVPDLLVGARGQAVDGNSFQGQAFLFSGANGALLFTLDTPTPGVFVRFGDALAGPGDLNGDGVPDLLVGAPGQDVDGNRTQGQAFLFSGADGALLFTLDDPIPQANARFGFALAGVGDGNGDGIPDLLVGARLQDVRGNENQGQAFRFLSVAIGHHRHP